MEQVVNEKIKWSSLLIALGLYYIGIPKWKEYRYIKDIYDVVNSKSAIPNSEESKFIEKIRQEVISNIETSNLFNRFDKKYIIDSISTIEFRVVDSIIPFSSDASACYLYIKPIRGKYKYLLDTPDSDNFVVINRADMKKDTYASTITHEIYHYFDRLITNSEKRYSDVVDISKFIDKRLNDEKYVKDKIEKLFMFRKNLSDSEKSKVKIIVDMMYGSFIEAKDYYTTDDELFVRYKTLKHDMIKNGVIKDINQVLTKDNILKYLSNCDTDEQLQHMYVIISLDLDRLEEIEKVI